MLLIPQLLPYTERRFPRKCFYASCGHAIPSGTLQGDSQGALDQIVDTILQDCHTELVSQKGQSNGYAYQFLTEKRGIHEQVPLDLPELGAVPRHYDVSKVFAPHLFAIAERGKELDEKIRAAPKRRLEAWHLATAMILSYSLAKELDAVQLAWLLTQKFPLYRLARGTIGARSSRWLAA